MGKGAEGSMESRAEGRERGTEGELKCLGRAWQCLWSWLDHGSERFPGRHCGNPGGLNGIQGVTGVFLAEKFESPTRCIESLAPPIGPRPFGPVQSLLERTACPAKTSIYATKAATKAGNPLLLLALR